MTRVSVVVPLYNRRRYAVETVESALAQSFQDLEVLVVDDASTDGGPEELEHRFGDRIRLIRLPTNQGRSVARNIGWSQARGDLVAFLDSDDLWLPGNLARQVASFSDPDVVLSHSWVGRVDADGNPMTAESAKLRREFERATRRGYDYGGITETWCRMYTSAVVVRRGALQRSGGFDPRLSHFEDWDVFWQVARMGKVATIEEALVLHRTHPGNTPSVWIQSAEQWLTVCRKHLADLPAQAPEEHLRRARHNLLVNMSLGEYWRRNRWASRRWMWRALAVERRPLWHPTYYVWGAPLVHAFFPRMIADRIVRAMGVDDYRDVSPATDRRVTPPEPRAQRVGHARQGVTLVIDDSPTDATGLLLHELERAGHRAVLFILGCNVAGREAVLVEAIQRGFALGNHSYTHPRFSAIDLSAARDEIVRTDALIDAVYALSGKPRPGKWFRFPYLDTGGARHRDLQALLGELGFSLPPALTSRLDSDDRRRVDWPSTLRTLDWDGPSDDEFRNRLCVAQAGDIIEVHDKVTAPRLWRPLIEELHTRLLVAVLPSR